MKRFVSLCAALFLSSAVVPCMGTAQEAPATQETGAGPSTLVTVQPKKGGETATAIPETAVHAKVAGKDAPVVGWHHFGQTATQPNLQLVLLIDDSARTSLGLHQKELQTFLTDQPPTTEVALAYMQDGVVTFTGPFTTEHQQVAQTLRQPMAVAGSNPSPYFALQDLLKRWPSHNPNERREVVMISDGRDRYAGLNYDPENPYITSTIRDLIKTHVIVYSIFYRDAGFLDRTQVGQDVGQNYLMQLSGAVGGELFYQGFGNPVDFTPYLKDITQKLASQYELRVTPPQNAKNVVNLKVQVSAPNTRVEAPQQIFVGPGQ